MSIIIEMQETINQQNERIRALEAEIAILKDDPPLQLHTTAPLQELIEHWKARAEAAEKQLAEAQASEYQCPSCGAVVQSHPPEARDSGSKAVGPKPEQNTAAAKASGAPDMKILPATVQILPAVCIRCGRKIAKNTQPFTLTQGDLCTRCIAEANRILDGKKLPAKSEKASGAHLQYFHKDSTECFDDECKKMHPKMIEKPPAKEGK